MLFVALVWRGLWLLALFYLYIRTILIPNCCPGPTKTCLIMFLLLSSSCVSNSHLQQYRFSAVRFPFKKIKLNILNFAQNMNSEDSSCSESSMFSTCQIHYEPKNAALLLRNNPNAVKHSNYSTWEHVYLPHTVFPLWIVQPCAHLQQGQPD